MPSRFRIPGGSLDFDSSDEDQEVVPAQLEGAVLPLPEPAARPQSIMNLTPTDLSCLLSWISHPLAANTAEYVRALNLSGAAFRNLDLSALNILADHDPIMAAHLVRIQGGKLPRPPPFPSAIPPSDALPLSKGTSFVSSPPNTSNSPEPFDSPPDLTVEQKDSNDPGVDTGHTSCADRPTSVDEPSRTIISRPSTPILAPSQTDAADTGVPDLSSQTLISAYPSQTVAILNRPELLPAHQTLDPSTGVSLSNSPSNETKCAGTALSDASIAQTSSSHGLYPSSRPDGVTIVSGKFKEGLNEPNPKERAHAEPSSSASVSTPLPAPNHVNDTSCLDVPLLQFSPVSFGSRAHDAAGELFKDSIHSSAADAADGLSTGGSSEQPSQLEPRSADTAESTRSTLLSDGSLGDEGTTLLPSENSVGDGSPVRGMRVEPFLAEYRFNQPNHRTHPEVYLPRRHDRTVGSLGTDEGLNFGTCDDTSLSPNLNHRASVRSRSHVGEVICVGGLDSPVKINPGPPPAGDAAASHAPDSRSESAESCLLLTDRNENPSSGETHDHATPCMVRPPHLGLTIPVSPTSLQEELSQLSPLFSPMGRPQQDPTAASSMSERLFSERAFSVPRIGARPPIIKLRRGQTILTHQDSRGTKNTTTGLEVTKILVDASMQTDNHEDGEVEGLRRRIKSLERELVRGPKSHTREPKPKSFWKRVASTSRVVPPPTGVRFGSSKHSLVESNSGTKMAPSPTRAEEQ